VYSCTNSDTSDRFFTVCITASYNRGASMKKFRRFIECGSLRFEERSLGEAL